MRTDNEFDRFYKDACDQGRSCNIATPETETGIASSRLSNRANRKMPHYLADSVVMSTLGHMQAETQTGESDIDSLRMNLKRKMFEVVDRIISELERRFSDNEPCLIACDAVDPSSDSFMQFDIMKPLAEKYHGFGYECARLKSQASVAKELFLKTDDSRSVLRVLLSMKSGNKLAFSDLVAFVVLVLTLPVSSAEAERTFSSMKRIKNFLRTTMTDERLSDLRLISLERELSY